MALLRRILRDLPLLLISPILFLLPPAVLLLSDLCWALLGRKRPPADRQPGTQTASVVIPNWNGRDLLGKYLPSVLAGIERHPGSEVIVVDDASTDGSVKFLRESFPGVKVVALTANLGFGGASNAGFAAARNDVVVLLNSDMRVQPDFLQPLLDGFTDEKVFAVSCQILFSDPAKQREETGLTQGWWENGGLRVRHRIDEEVREPYPCFYGGGGSCAFDRRKFLELGGFDELLRPFYLEDTDLGYQAWKRGWKVLYQPASVVYHEHRATIGKRFSPGIIQAALLKNFLLFTWKNIHDWKRLGGHFFFAGAGALLSVAFGDSLERPNLAALWRACLRLPQACRSRWRARNLAGIPDIEAFQRSMGGYFRDCFTPLDAKPEPLRVLFVSPYPICPPVHGGAVFMYQTATELASLCELHLVVLLDHDHQREQHDELASRCGSIAFLTRVEGQRRQFASILPHAVSEHADADLEWLIHRQIYTRRIDAVQLEYLPMGQYHGSYRRLAEFLFEHDIYFQSISRSLPGRRSVQRALAGFEYLRALRYELRLLPKLDRVQVCSVENRRYLASFLPTLDSRVDDNLRAGIDVRRYEYQASGRQAHTMLFLGSFRHLPNQEALHWFVNQALPHVLRRKPEARLIVYGSDPPPRHSLPDLGPAIDLRGFVEDVREPLSSCALFLCPILSGSGVRVKLLEAFAAGIPVVSTRLGAEGLATEDGKVCALADDPESFAGKILHLFDHREEAEEMARRARAEVQANWDMPVLTRRLVESYRTVVEDKRRA